jgi:hypothetical protein
MWGNALGWRISAVLFVLAMGVGLWLRGQMQITDPTALSVDPKNLAPLSPPIGDGILSQDKPGDAGEKYASAAALYQSDPDSCDDFTTKPDGPPPAAMQQILDAAHLSSMNLFAKDPAGLIDYQSDHPVLDGLSKLGEEMNAVALRFKQAGKPNDARNFLTAVYALGVNLVRERLDYDEFSHGTGLMDGALQGLQELEPVGSSKAQDLQSRQDAMTNFNQQTVQPIYDVLASADPVKIAANAGDIFRFATKSQEPMFRVEAILKLGRYRFDSARPADQLAAPRFLRNLSQDPNAAIRAAAQAAANLTVEQYRMIH